MKHLKTALLASLALTGTAAAQTAFTLDQNGTSLASFTVDGTGLGSLALTSTDGEPISLDALTFRPETGQLYGYEGDTGSLYTIDTATGIATLEVQDSRLPSGFVSFDINNNLDAFRFINETGENVVYFPEDTANPDPMNPGRFITEAPAINPVAYGDTGTFDADGTPSLIGNGYTNELPRDAALAQSDDLLQFVLDADTDTIGILNNNAGTVDLLAASGFDFDIAGGFDVYSTADSDIGYALLTVNGQQSFFEIDLGTYAFTELFSVQTEFGSLTSLAVFDPEAVPVPAAALLFVTGAGLLARRRRQRSA
jgi:hypothetical protein